MKNKKMNAVLLTSLLWLSACSKSHVETGGNDTPVPPPPVQETDFAAFPSVVNLKALVSDPIDDGKGHLEQPIYGSSFTVVLYNRSKVDQVKDLSFPTLASEEMTISPHGCASGNLDSRNICAFEIIYKPKTSVPAGQKTLNISYTVNGVSKILPVVVNYSTEKKSNSSQGLYQNLLSEMNAQKAQFAFINNCNEQVWLANKPLPTFGPHGVMEKDQLIKQGSYFILDDAYAKSLFLPNKNGSPSNPDFALSQGFPSLNFYAKFGCDSKGTNCKIGQVTGKDTLTPDQSCVGNFCQADTFTKFEMSFGCTLQDKSQCSKNPSDPKKGPLSPESYMDGTFLDGFSYNVAFDVFPAANETQEQCFGVPDSKLDIQKSLTDPDHPLGQENLTSVASQWSIMRTDLANQAKWEWTDTTPPMGWAPDEYASPINLIGQENWNKGVADLRALISTFDDNGQQTNATFQAYNSLDPSKNTFLVAPKQVSCFDAIFDQSTANQINKGCKGNPDQKCLPTTQIDLTSRSLLMQQRDPGTGEIVAGSSLLSVAGPGQMLTSDRHWGGLGLGSQCLYIGGHAFEVGSVEDITSAFYPTYFDRDIAFPTPKSAVDAVGPFSSFTSTYSNLTLMYANPYDGVGLAVKDAIEDNAQVSKSAYIYQSFRKFCVDHPDFCVKSDDGKNGAGGLAPLFGNMGPVNDTNFVKYVRKNAPGYYSWQYDDYNATRVCRSPESKMVVILCGKDQDTPKYPVK